MGETYETWPAGATATMNVTYKQGNAAGGAVVCEITPGFGQEFIILAGQAVCSGTNGISIAIETAAGGTNISKLNTDIASGAGTSLNFGSGVSNTQAKASGQGAGDFLMMVSGLQALVIKQTGAGAQNDTFSIRINVRIRFESIPTVIHSNSTNPGDVTVTAGSEIFTVV